jgi:hypothetical protein
MRGFSSLAREYEAQRYPPTRRLDVHAEGPGVARDRALRWIQSRAHETPGVELLLIVERGGRPGAGPGPVRRAVERMLRDVEGRLVAWWGPFTDGSLALRLADAPDLRAAGEPTAEPHDDPLDGRTPETAGAALPDTAADIPPEILPAARQAAELRRDREGLSLGLAEVVLRRVWIEAQATAMADRISFAEAVGRLLDAERAMAVEE